MEDDGEETPRSPFWIQSTTNLRRVERYRRRLSAVFFNSGVLIILLLLFAVVSMVFIIPSLISFTSNIFRPNLVKKSWDSINLVLVLFALAFGFLSRNINNDNKVSFDNGFDRSRSDLSTGAPAVSTPHQWYDFPEQPIGFNTGLRRHRSSSSYPDLRELSPPWNHRAGDPWRFSDDTHLNSYRVLDSDRYYIRHLSRREQDPETKTVVDLPKKDLYTPPSPPPITEEISYAPPSPPPLPPQPPALTPTNDPAPETEPRVTAQSLPSFQDSEQQGGSGIRTRGKGERRRARSSETRKMVSPINDPAPEPSSPPHIQPEFQESDKKTGRVERKRNGAYATKEFFTSFYQKRKKKRQRHKSVDNLDTLLHHPVPPPVKYQLPPPSPSPPPPPPPPPPSVLNNLFTSKKEKRKKLQSAPPSPRAPPPTAPPPTAARAPKPTTARVSPFVTEKPRVPVKMSVFNSIDDSSSGGESPLGRIPPPPPMPPFKMADWKFAVEGDYIRLQSTLSSGSGSPDGDDARSPSSVSPLFCPSPDVDTKADSFIARFRAGLKLEKINSFNQNQSLRLSNLGPGPCPCPSPKR